VTILLKTFPEKSPSLYIFLLVKYIVPSFYRLLKKISAPIKKYIPFYKIEENFFSTFFFKKYFIIHLLIEKKTKNEDILLSFVKKEDILLSILHNDFIYLQKNILMCSKAKPESSNPQKPKPVTHI